MELFSRYQPGAFIVSISTYAVPDLGETVIVPPIGPLLTLTSLIALDIGCDI